MRKGSMSLPILTNGAIRTVHIRQGDVFLLPGRSAIFYCDLFLEPNFWVELIGLKTFPII